MNNTLAHFKVLKKLGQGGMGCIYLARDMQLNRRIALKLLPAQFSSNQFLKTRFKREAQAAAALKHPNIITVFELGEYEQGIYIAMEYINGKPLNEWIQSGELKTLSVINIVIQVCRGLRKAHGAGIIHRDIKPPNIMIDREGWVKILDFGLAKIQNVTQITKQGTRLGTIPYMSPEQIRGKDLDQRSDIYSLGVVLYQLLTRRLPFKGSHEDEIYYSILHRTAEPVARYKEGVTEGLQRIIDKTLEKDPEMRFQHVEELLADLKRERRIYKNLVQSTVSLAPGRPASTKKAGGLRFKKRKLPTVKAARVASLVLAVMVTVLGFGVVADQNVRGYFQGLPAVFESVWARIVDSGPFSRKAQPADLAGSDAADQNDKVQTTASRSNRSPGKISVLHSSLIQKLSNISSTDKLLDLLNIYSQLMLITVGNRSDVGDANGCFLFVVDQSKVVARFQQRQKRLHALDSAKNLTSLSGHFPGKFLIWVRDHSILDPKDQVGRMNLPMRLPESLKSRQQDGDEFVVLVLESPYAKDSNLHARLLQPDEISRRGELRLRDFKVLN